MVVSLWWESVAVEKNGTPLTRMNRWLTAGEFLSNELEFILTFGQN